jgi:hypothetical protein
MIFEAIVFEVVKCPGAASNEKGLIPSGTQVIVDIGTWLREVD